MLLLLVLLQLAHRHALLLHLFSLRRYFAFGCPNRRLVILLHLHIELDYLASEPHSPGLLDQGGRILDDQVDLLVLVRQDHWGVLFHLDLFRGHVLLHHLRLVHHAVHLVFRVQGVYLLLWRRLRHLVVLLRVRYFHYLGFLLLFRSCFVVSVVLFGLLTAVEYLFFLLLAFVVIDFRELDESLLQLAVLLGRVSLSCFLLLSIQHLP